MEWIEKGSKLQKVHPLGFVVVKPKDAEPPVPLFCPNCVEPMRKAEDAKYFRKYECCTTCGIKYAEPNKKKWGEGWRPDI